MSADIRVGRLVFKYVGGKYACPMCSLDLLEGSIVRHLEAHDRRDEKKRANASKRELGMSPPPPGQLALGIGGGTDVPPKAKEV